MAEKLRSQEQKNYIVLVFCGLCLLYLWSRQTGSPCDLGGLSRNVKGTDPWELKKSQGGNKSQAQMESLKRSVSYSQPNICASQAAINLAQLFAQLASVRRHFKAWARILHNHLVLIGPVGEAGRVLCGCGVRRRLSPPSQHHLGAIFIHSLGFRERILGVLEGTAPTWQK